MLDPAQIAKPALPEPLADLSHRQTNRPGPLATPQSPRQKPDRTPVPHSSLLFPVASDPNIKIQCKPLKTKNGDPC